MNMMDPLVGEFVDVVLAEVHGARSASHDSPVGSARIHFKSLFFEQPAIENGAGEPRIGAGGAGDRITCSTARGQGACLGEVCPKWRVRSLSAIIPCLSRLRLPSWGRRRSQAQHAPGRFHSGAQVVKETEQATPPLADATRLRIRAHARASAAGFRFNIKEIRND